MKLSKLHDTSSPKRIFVEYVARLRNLRGPGLVTEGKRVVVTTEIIDDDEEEKKAAQEAKNRFVEQAQKLGQFDNPEWVRQLINGMKQAGIHGVNSISEEARPVTMGEVRMLIGLLVDLLGHK